MRGKSRQPQICANAPGRVSYGPMTLIIALAVGLILAMFVRAVRETIALRRMRAGTEREHDMPRVASYFASFDPPVRALPERAWTDLDLDDVFRRLDRTASWPGQHLLYARMRREEQSPASLLAFEGGVDRLTRDETARATVRASLAPLAHRRASALPVLFQGALPSVPPFAAAFPLLSIAGLACLVAAFWWPPLALGVAAIALTNVFIRVALRERIDRTVAALRMLPALLRAAIALSALEGPGLASHAAALRDAVPRLQWIGRAARWLSFDPRGSELVGWIYEYLNMLFLLDVTTFAWCLDAIRDERATIGRAYAALGELDCLQSVAAVRLERHDWTRPAFDVGGTSPLAFTGLSHPLLSEAVPNSLDMRGRSALLTGSNMSGKSTFIRTVGVNAVLAQTIHTVFAASWHSPRCAVRTVIGRADSILDGTSYYRAEVDAVGGLLHGDGGARRLILMDELFRGTNSLERVAAASAVLAHLGRGDDLIIVATHDVELLELRPEYATFHFREEVRGGELTFDYRLHEGPCSTRNAIAILELAGYPREVVEDARATAAARGGALADARPVRA
jgi:hypothetical protein